MILILTLKIVLRGASACHFAVRQGNLDMLKLLINLGANFKVIDNGNQNLLHAACWAGHIDIIEHLINNLKFNINSKDSSGTCCHIAAAKGDLDLLKVLIGFGSDFKILDVNGANLLHAAVSQGHTEMIEYLTKELSFRINSKDDKGLTVCHYVCLSNDINCLKTIIKLGSDHNKLDNIGNNLLHMASFRSDAEFIEYLIRDLKFDLNVLNKNGYTACHFAVSSANLIGLKALVKMGANFNKLTGNGKNLLDLAIINNNLEIIEYLINDLKFRK